jgi:hypothetical protein
MGALLDNVPIFFSAPNNNESARRLRESKRVLLNAQHTANSGTSSFGIILIAPPTTSPRVVRVSRALTSSLASSTRKR